jgi:hypothetical protein
MAFSAGNGSMIVLSQPPGRESPAYPVMSFLVESIVAIVRALAGRGVEFLAPAAESLAGVEGVARVTWSTSAMSGRRGSATPRAACWRSTSSPRRTNADRD